MVNSDSYIGVELFINEDKSLFDELFAKKDEIESQLGFEFEWLRLDNKKCCRIIHKIPGLDFDNHDNYPELMD